MDINENIVIKEEELMIGFVICVWRISLVLMVSRHIKNICINNSFVMIVLWLKVSPANYAQAVKSAIPTFFVCPWINYLWVISNIFSFLENKSMIYLKHEIKYRQLLVVCCCKISECCRGLDLDIKLVMKISLTIIKE